MTNQLNIEIADEMTRCAYRFTFDVTESGRAHCTGANVNQDGFTCKLDGATALQVAREDFPGRFAEALAEEGVSLA